MKQYGKRLLAVLLAMLMLASLCIAAFAADAGESDTTTDTGLDDNQTPPTATFSPNGGTFEDGTTEAKVVTAEKDSRNNWVIAIPAAPKLDGKDFSVWTSSSGRTIGAGGNATITGETTFTATWIDKEYYVTFNANGGTFSDGSTSKRAKAAKGRGGRWSATTPEEPTYDGKRFLGWGEDTVSAGASVLVDIDNITDYLAQWESEQCVITYVNEMGDAPESVTVTDHKLPDPLPTLDNVTGYTFKGWLMNGQLCEAGASLARDADSVTLTAKWEKKTTGSSTVRPGGSSGGFVSGGTTSYSVSGGSGTADNGSWTTDKDSAPKGDTVTITLKPESGYQGVPTVKDSKGNSVTVTRKNDTTYTFVMPDGSVTISVEFTAIAQTIVNPFVDVSEDQYYYDAVLWALENLITQGTGDGTTFSPNDSCTRAQAVTFLWRAAGEPEPATTVNPFTDVEGGYYYKAMLWAVEKGITQGTGDGTTFSPNDTVNRGQMVTFLWRAAGKPAVSGATAFTDVDNGAYYAEAVQWANGKIVQGGMGDNLFAPGDNCTRGQIVTMLFRAQ